jgi:hypothetical protein
MGCCSRISSNSKTSMISFVFLKALSGIMWKIDHRMVRLMSRKGGEFDTFVYPICYDQWIVEDCDLKLTEAINLIT